MQTIEEYKEYTQQLEGEVKKWHDAFDASEQMNRNLVADKDAETRRLKRALWLARAERAESEARGWYHSTGYCVKYDGGHTIKGALFGKGLLRLPDEWMKIWINVEHKCRAKAEEYK